MNEISVREWRENYAAGKYDSNDYNTRKTTGWHDWVCEDSELSTKTKTIGAVIAQIKDGGRINLDTMNVRLYNINQGTDGQFDEIRFVELDSDTSKYEVTIGLPLFPETYTVYTNGLLKYPVFRTSSTQELVKFLNSRTKCIYADPIRSEYVEDCPTGAYIPEPVECHNPTATKEIYEDPKCEVCPHYEKEPGRTLEENARDIIMQIYQSPSERGFRRILDPKPRAVVFYGEWADYDVFLKGRTCMKPVKNNNRFYKVKITGGQYLGSYNRISNRWYWREVYDDGSLSKEEYVGYGNFYVKETV